MEKNIKVKLTADLTKYAKGLVPGTEGITVGRWGICNIRLPDAENHYFMRISKFVVMNTYINNSSIFNRTVIFLAFPPIYTDGTHFSLFAWSQLFFA